MDSPSRAKSKPADTQGTIAIIGGGPFGLTVASALARRGTRTSEWTQPGWTGSR